jgi:hypothetical protein
MKRTPPRPNSARVCDDDLQTNPLGLLQLADHGGKVAQARVTCLAEHAHKALRRLLDEGREGFESQPTRTEYSKPSEMWSVVDSKPLRPHWT